MAPAGIEISMIGSISAVCTSATLSADDVICVIAQAAPTPWINRPRLDSRLASQMRRNTACRSGAKMPLALALPLIALLLMLQLALIHHVAMTSGIGFAVVSRVVTISGEHASKSFAAVRP